MKFVVTILLIGLYFYVCDGYVYVFPNTQTRQADYYWRDYFGVIPADAIKGGSDEYGNVTYIGQFLVHVDGYTSGIQPGTIYPGQKKAVAVHVGKFVYNEQYVKILCSPRHDLVMWRQVELKDMHLLVDYHIVIGGWDQGTPLYIGRANVDNQVMIGKIYPKDSQKAKAGLTLMSKGSQIKLLSFELLVYTRT